MNRPYSRATAIAPPLATTPRRRRAANHSSRANCSSADGAHVGGVRDLAPLLLLVFDLRALGNELKPLPAIAVWWTNRSLAPSSGVMKP
jgi:hypothetical protein